MPTNSVPAVSGCKLSFFMSFNPTKQQLEELGFKDVSFNINDTKITRFTSKRFDYGQSQIFAEFRAWWVVFELYIFNQDEDFEQSTRLFPESIDDIRTLIRLLSPNN